MVLSGGDTTLRMPAVQVSNIPFAKEGISHYLLKRMSWGVLAMCVSFNCLTLFEAFFVQTMGSGANLMTTA